MPSQEKGSVIKASGLTKTYNGVNVVDGLVMNVREGDIYGFVGKNGSGKSTTMKMICGLISPNAGDLDVLGGNPSEKSGFTGIGSLIEAPGMLDHMSALSNVLYKACALGVANPEAESRKLLDLVGLSNTGSKPARSFSLGMKQRLGIALALVGSPRILLLDEPFNGLDPAATHEMREALQRLNRERGMTILVSSHVLDQLNRFATRFGVIDSGRMIVEFESERMEEMAAGVIRVRCTDMKAAKTALDAVPGSKVSEAKDGALLVAGADVTIEQVSSALFEAKLQVLELVRTQRDVEEFFLDLMGSSAASAAYGTSGSKTEQPSVTYASSEKGC